MISKVKLVNIPVADQDRALRFYCDVLGFSKLADLPAGPGQRWIELGALSGGAKVVLYAPPDCGLLPGCFMNVVFTCSDVEQEYRRLKRENVAFVQEFQTAEWGSSCIFKDSEGNSFALTTDN
jgi:predicted enzyme related to lactoylglutathione lyase